MGRITALHAAFSGETVMESDSPWLTLATPLFFLQQQPEKVSIDLLDTELMTLNSQIQMFKIKSFKDPKQRHFP